MSKRRRRRQRGKRDQMLKANSSNHVLTFTSSESSLEFMAQEGDALPQVSMLAYNGGPMRFPQFRFPVIVDLKGLDISKQNRPLLRDHNKSREIGHTTSIEARDGKLYVEGVLSADNQDARQVLNTARNGFPYQASIGTPYRKQDFRFIRAGDSVEVNGRQWRGPVFVLVKSRLKETSVVTLGADDDSETRIAAMQQEGANMDFEAWLRAHDWDPETLTDGQREVLEAQWESEQDGDNNRNRRSRRTVTQGDVDDTILNVREQVADEEERIGEIRAICKGNEMLCAQAIRDNWSPTKAELEMMKQGRSSVNGVVRAGNEEASQLNESVLEAAMCESIGMASDHRESFFTEQHLEAADEFNGIGLQDLAMLCAQLAGQDLGRTWGDGEKWIKAAFSTNSLPSILENVLHKQALIAYRAEPIQALQIAKIGRTSDFKQVSRLRLFGTGAYEKLGAGGVIPSGKLSDQKFTNQADTYGNLVFIDRQTMINDDLGMLSDAGMMLGDDGREKLNDLVFGKLLSNQDAQGNAFFVAGNNNVITGATSELGLTGEGLKEALIKFRKQKAGPGEKAKDQRPINITPRILLVPPELEVTAQILVGSNSIGAGENDRGDMNPWKGRYRVVVAPHLSDSYYNGNSATAWYLLAEPNRLPTIELLALNGRVEPNIERVTPPANQLGVGFRGYIDVGAEFMDPKGAVRAAGA